MSRPLPQHQRTVVLRLLRGETDAPQAAAELDLSHRSLLSLRQRYLRSKLPAMDGSVTASLSAAAHIRRDHWGAPPLKSPFWVRFADLACPPVSIPHILSIPHITTNPSFREKIC